MTCQWHEKCEKVWKKSISAQIGKEWKKAPFTCSLPSRDQSVIVLPEKAEKATLLNGCCAIQVKSPDCRTYYYYTYYSLLGVRPIAELRINDQNKTLEGRTAAGKSGHQLITSSEALLGLCLSIYSSEWQVALQKESIHCSIGLLWVCAIQSKVISTQPKCQWICSASERFLRVSTYMQRWRCP